MLVGCEGTAEQNADIWLRFTDLPFSSLNDLDAISTCLSSSEKSQPDFKWLSWTHLKLLQMAKVDQQSAHGELQEIPFYKWKISLNRSSQYGKKEWVFEITQRVPSSYIYWSSKGLFNFATAHHQLDKQLNQFLSAETVELIRQNWEMARKTFLKSDREVTVDTNTGEDVIGLNSGTVKHFEWEDRISSEDIVGILLRPRAQSDTIRSNSPLQSITHDESIRAPFNGKVVRVEGILGSHIEKHQVLFVIEAMKMETSIRSPISGTIDQLLISFGDIVQKGQLVAIIGRRKE